MNLQRVDSGSFLFVRGRLCQVGMITPTVGCTSVPTGTVLDSTNSNAAKCSISGSATGPPLVKKTRPVVVPSLVHDSDESAAEPPSPITTVDKRIVEFDEDCVVNPAASLVLMLRQERARPLFIGLLRRHQLLAYDGCHMMCECLFLCAFHFWIVAFVFRL